MTEAFTAAAPPLYVSLHRVNGRKVQAEPVPLPERGCVLGSEGLLGETLGSGLFVAHRHAQIMPLCGHWMLLPADADMVCVFNGKKMPWGEPQALDAGDSVQLGFTEWRFVQPEGLYAAEPLPALPETTPSQSLAEILDTTTLLPSTSPPRLGELYLETLPEVLPEALPETLPPEAALMAQLAADFAASPTSSALYFAPGQALDDILCPAPDAPPAPLDLWPLPGTASAEHLTEHSGNVSHVVLLPESATLGERADITDLADLAALSALAEGADKAAPSLEDILDGPLNIDDVLRSLSAQGQGPELLAPEHTSLTGWDTLENEIPPDPLLLLDRAKAAPRRPEAQAPPTPWPLTHDPLSPLLGREHHHPGIHSAYSAGGQQLYTSALPTPSPPPSEES